MHSAALLLVSAICLIPSLVYGYNDGNSRSEARSTGNTGAPAAIVISPSEYFEGNDGPWSSFNLRVGTPKQDVRVLVSTASPETLVVLSEYGCSTAVFSDVPSDCAVSRGNLFTPNESSTWYDAGTFAINGDGVGLEANLGYYQRAQFGLETLGVGFVDGSTGPTLENHTVAGIATASPFYLGIFGLNTQPVNFSTLGNYSAPSFITTLKDEDIIPSLSWSYTAGAKYRLKQVFGQLIFSGYDTSRFTENSVSFSMADDLTRDLVVALQSISYSGSDKTTLLSSPINIYIDSTDPNLWLPDDVCDAFESAFGLTVDNTTGLYLVNDTHHSTLVATDAEVSFRLSDVLEGGDSVTIVLPYDAFALKAEYPLVENISYYFPLKRAANETQYTLGRVFLQEAYLTADYERQVFNVSQCTWVEGAEENIVTITSKDANITSSSSASASATQTTETTKSNSSTLSNGTITGTVIACLVFLVLVAVGVFFFLRHRKAAKAREAAAAVDTAPSSPESGIECVDLSMKAEQPRAGLSNVYGELEGDDHHVYQLHEEPRRPPLETPMFELPGSLGRRMELDAISTATGASQDNVPLGRPSPAISPSPAVSSSLTHIPSPVSTPPPLK